MYWEKNRLFQRVGNRRAELGYIRYDEAERKFVLMLSGESLGLSSSHYVVGQGQAWDTLEEAKEKAAACPEATLAHHIWMTKDERVVYVEIILIILENPKLQLSKEDIENIRSAVRSAPLSKLKEVVGWLANIKGIAELASKLLQLLVGG